MINKILVITILTAFISSQISAQNGMNGDMKVGRWAHKDARDLVYAEGDYKDNIREGRWLFFVSPISRYTHSADVKGEYNSAGQKIGTWTFVSSSTKIKVEAEFDNDLMEGPCTYYGANGGMLATGLMSAGIRHGKWVFHHNGKKMTEGYYQNGIKIGDWVYDYFPAKDMHIKGSFNYDTGVKDGRLEYYKVDRHPKFGIDELLSGVGTYSNGKKIGRWIEYSQGLKGEFVETGNYNRSGERHGYWKSTVERRNYQAAMYDKGTLNGAFKQYHDNGKLKYQTTFSDGLATGKFTRYFENGNMEEKGTTIFSPNPEDLKKDTLYFFLDLPYEYHFQLIELKNFHELDHHYVAWIADPGYSIEPAIMDRHFNLYKDYGREPHKRIVKINVVGKKAVRDGGYQSFFTNGQVKLEGNYHPKVSEVFDPATNTVIRDYSRTGEWKEYDDNGYIMRTLLYNKGELIRILDDKGKEMGIGTNSSPSTEENNDDGEG
jgi:antitoxin component YwqK of YwqJK toxin-antitoxin module